MQYKEEESQSIKAALASMLSDSHFKSSPQMSAFISYIVEQTLSGKADRIKAYTIAVDALGKPDDFDPQSNPSVRVLAKRLRDNLDDYYQGDGKQANIRISIKPGSYVPIFEKQKPELTVTSLSANANNEDRPIANLKKGISALSSTRHWLESRHRQLTAGGVMLMAVFTWQLSDRPNSDILPSNHVTESPVQLAKDVLVSVDIASLEHFQQTTDRPLLPRITLINTDRNNKNLTPVKQFITGFLKEYENFIIGEQSISKQGITEKWPEDYELHYSSTDDNTIELAVKHAMSGRILSRKEIANLLPIETSSQSDVLLAFSRKLIENNGLILKDYLSNDDLTPTMRCAFLFDAYYSDKTRKNRKSAEQCATNLKNAGLISTIPEIL